MSTSTRVMCVFSLAIVATLLIPSAASAQFPKGRTLRSNKGVEKARSLRRLSPELRRHTSLLQRALSRYLTSGDPFTPYLTSHQFWLELRGSRIGSDGTATRRSREEILLLWSAYRELEQDIERIMLDDQMALYQNALELSEVQYERIDAVLRKDAESKFRMLVSGNVTDASFLQNLTRISTDSETLVRKELFPEQLQIYDRRQTEFKMIWTA